MFLSKLVVTREGYYGYSTPDPKKPLLATIEVIGKSGKVELSLSPDLSKRIVAIVADEVAAAGRATAEMMTADALSVAALPAA